MKLGICMYKEYVAKKHPLEKGAPLPLPQWCVEKNERVSPYIYLQNVNGKSRGGVR